MKIVFIQPPVRDFYLSKGRMTPLGLLSLAAAVKCAGFDAELIDCASHKTRASIPIPHEMTHLKKYYHDGDQSPFKLFGNYYHFGMDDETLKSALADSKGDVFCITALMTPYYGETLRVARIVKEVSPGSVVIVGGGHATLLPETMLASPDVDFVIRGEGEEILPTLLDIAAKGNPESVFRLGGVCYKNNGRLFISEERLHINIKTSPAPLYDLPGFGFYKFGGRRIAPVLLSRGCPHSCVYCSVPDLFGKIHRIRNPKNVVEEMLQCHEKHQVRIFDFEDDNLTFSRESAMVLFSEIAKRLPLEEIECMAMNGITASSLDPEILEAMKAASFKTLNLALITSNTRLKDNLKRPFDFSHFAKIVRTAHDMGFSITGYQIVGMPGQTLPEMQETFSMLKSLPLKIGISVFYPLPATKMFDVCASNNLIKRDSYEMFRSTALPIECCDFSRDDIYTFLMAGRIHNFLSENNSESSAPLPDFSIENSLNDGDGILGIRESRSGKIDKRGIAGILLRILTDTGALYSLKNFNADMGNTSRATAGLKKPTIGFDRRYILRRLPINSNLIKIIH